MIQRIGSGPYGLTGPVYTGMQVSMGRWAVLAVGKLRILLTEQPALTFDPETFRHVGLDPAVADVIVVRSAALFRAGFRGVAGEAIFLDLPGATTPRLGSLRFERATEPLYIV